MPEQPDTQPGATFPQSQLGASTTIAADFTPSRNGVLIFALIMGGLPSLLLGIASAAELLDAVRFMLGQDRRDSFGLVNILFLTVAATRVFAVLGLWRRRAEATTWVWLALAVAILPNLFYVLLARWVGAFTFFFDAIATVMMIAKRRSTLKLAP